MMKAVIFAEKGEYFDSPPIRMLVHRRVTLLILNLPVLSCTPRWREELQE